MANNEADRNAELHYSRRIHPPDRESRAVSIVIDGRHRLVWGDRIVPHPSPDPPINYPYRHMDRAERLTKYALESGALGLDAYPISTKNHRTPDFEVNGDRWGYLVEVKTREALFGNWELPRLERDLDGDREAWNWLRDCSEQCVTVDPFHERLWFLWAVMAGVVEESQMTRVEAALYGIRHGYNATSIEARAIKVRNVGRGAFEAYAGVDGVVIQIASEQWLLANPYSPRIDCVLSSRLARLPQPGSDLVLPDDLDRNDSNATLGFVRAALKMPDFCFFVREVHSENNMLGRLARRVRAPDGYESWIPIDEIDERQSVMPDPEGQD